MTAKSKCMTCYAYGHREGFGEGYEQGKKDERERQNPRLDNMYKQAKQVGFSQARKQTLEEVLKHYFETGDKYLKGMHLRPDIIKNDKALMMLWRDNKEWLKQKIKEASK